MIVPNYFEDLQINHMGTMPNRSYFIPASERMENLVENREHSDRFQLLNGNWKFKYYNSIYDLSEHFYEEGFDAELWDRIPVPSVWQNHGYDSHQYTNVRFPFPADPPYVPVDNPCGTYLYDFVYATDKQALKAYLNFEGVDSCFYVWLNGKFLGCNQVSHSTSEFDVTDVIRTGMNKEIIDTARSITGREIPAIIEPRRAGDPSVLIASNKKAAEVLGWKPQRGLNVIVADAWNWHLNHPDGYEG